MDSNKSIDGLRTRRAKTGTLSSPKSAKSTTKQSPRPVKSVSHATSHIKPVKPTTSKPSTSSSRVKPVKTIKTATNSTKAKTATTKSSSPKTDVAPSQPQIAQNDTVTEHNISVAEDFLKPTQVFNFDERSGELKASDSATVSDSTKPKPKKAKKPVSKKRKIIKCIIVVILLLIIGGVVWLVLWGNDIIAKITGGQGNIFDLLTFTEPTYSPLKTDENGRTNILAFGTSGYNMDGDEGNGTHDGAQLTDSIMIISLNQENKDIVMLSLPRDLRASPTCTATGKINEVFWCNDGGKDGLENETKAANALMEEIGNILGIDFQYYAHLNWGSLVQIVDTLGGINVTLDEDILDYAWTGAVFKAGVEYTIDGAQALGLARARHGTAKGDFTRGASQQKILLGIKDKITEKGLSIPDLMNLASTLGDNLRTNFSLEDIKTLAHLASETDFDTIRQISLLEPEPLMTTGTINGISYVIPVGGIGNYTRIRSFIEKMLSSDPRVYEDASILVLNGTETPGLASAEQDNLSADNYKNIYTDNAPTGEYSTKYTLYTLTDDKPGTKKLLEEKYNTTALPSTDLPVGVSKNYDFVLIIGESPNTSTTE